MPPGFDPAFLSAAGLAGAIRARRISATEAVSQAFDRIDRFNPSLNVMVWQCRERALDRAKQLDASESSGPLHGVPVTIKESFAYPGSPSTWGIPPFMGKNSTLTAVVVERIERAGAIVIGKTNVPVGLGDWQSYNPIYGVTNNPWDLTRTPGGSTGGSAALAAGIGALALGSDIGGSLRIPAHFCGLYAHKPSLNLLSASGHRPGAWSGEPGYPLDLAVVGPMARDARDLLTAIEVTGGPESEDAIAWKWTMPPPRHTQLRDFRIGFMRDDPSAPLTAEVRALYDRVLKELEQSGATLEEGWPAGIDVPNNLFTYQYLMFALTNADIDPARAARLRAAYEQDPRNAYAAGSAAPHSVFLKESVNRRVFRQVWRRYFETHDVFLTPTAFTPAIKHDHSPEMMERVIETPEGPRPYGQLMNWIWPATLAGIPATAAPMGVTQSGLPAGFQIIGPMWEDATPIEFAALLAERIGGSVPPPGY